MINKQQKINSNEAYEDKGERAVDVEGAVKADNAAVFASHKRLQFNELLFKEFLRVLKLHGLSVYKQEVR